MTAETMEQQKPKYLARMFLSDTNIDDFVLRNNGVCHEYGDPNLVHDAAFMSGKNLLPIVPGLQMAAIIACRAECHAHKSNQHVSSMQVSYGQPLFAGDAKTYVRLMMDGKKDSLDVRLESAAGSHAEALISLSDKLPNAYLAGSVGHEFCLDQDITGSMQKSIKAPNGEEQICLAYCVLPSLVSATLYRELSMPGRGYIEKLASVIKGNGDGEAMAPMYTKHEFRWFEDSLTLRKGGKIQMHVSEATLEHNMSGRIHTVARTDSGWPLFSCTALYALGKTDTVMRLLGRSYARNHKKAA